MQETKLAGNEIITKLTGNEIISDNRLFNALMNREAGLNTAQNGFKAIRQEIEDFAKQTMK